MTKRIDITTAQNVVIDYKAATVFERLLAWIIDFLILAFGSLILHLLIMAFAPMGTENSFSLLFIAPTVLCYHLICEIFLNGTSPGKSALGLRVVKINNEPVRIYDFVIRWAFRLLDISSSIGLLAIITISSSPKNQRIGDYLADTTVVKITKTDRFSLRKIQELDSLKNYEPRYPEVVALSESDMLVIKEVLDRLAMGRTEISESLLKKTIQQVEEVIGVSAPRYDAEFLRVLIKDYVALTR